MKIVLKHGITIRTKTKAHLLSTYNRKEGGKKRSSLVMIVAKDKGKRFCKKTLSFTMLL
jgi:hypothetical protein